MTFWSRGGKGYWSYLAGISKEDPRHALCANVQAWCDENLRGRWLVFFDDNIGKAVIRREVRA